MLFTVDCWGPLSHRGSNWQSNHILSQSSRQVAPGNGIYDPYWKWGAWQQFSGLSHLCWLPVLQQGVVTDSLSTCVSFWCLSQLVVVLLVCLVLFLVAFHWPLRSLQGKTVLAAGLCAHSICLVYLNTEHIGLNVENPMAITAQMSVDIWPLGCMLTPFYHASSYLWPWDDRAETEIDWACRQEEKGQNPLTKASWKSERVVETNIAGGNCFEQRERTEVYWHVVEFDFGALACWEGSQYCLPPCTGSCPHGPAAT